jgi:hypothetical protein
MKIFLGRWYLTVALGNNCPVNIFLLEKKWGYGRGVVVELNNAKIIFTLPRNRFKITVN